MKAIRFFSIGVLLVLIGGQLALAEFPEARVTVQVTDQNADPVQDASVAIAGTLSTNPAMYKKGLTDARGLFAAQFQSKGEVGITVDKEGYYRSEFWKAYSFLVTPGAMDRAFATKRWEPWNPHLQAALKRVMKPIPMFARQINKGIPSVGEPIGFDFWLGDFVNPHGSGKQADVFLAVERQERSKDDYDYKIRVSFPNKMDGIAAFQAVRHGEGSELRSPYTAPESGLAAEWVLWRSRRPGASETSNYDPDNRGYFFRIRTVVDDAGKIVTSNYGKIYGEFMNFTYYLNPTPNDRNIEFDPKRNLFVDLKRIEQVTAP